jgi:hypothetical protein
MLRTVKISANIQKHSGRDAINRISTQRKNPRFKKPENYRSHALRGNAAMDALRPVPLKRHRLQRSCVA